jgi:hypothetical protein
LCGLIVILIFTGCSTAYKSAPVSFRSPASMANCIHLDGAQIGVKSYDERKEAAQAFGFDIIGSGILPVQVIFDNRSGHTFEIDGSQSFIEDTAGNMWTLLTREMAYERASRDTQNDQILKKGVSSGIMGAAAGAVIGSAIGIVTGTNIGAAAGKGAAVGGSIGIITGGIEGHANKDAQQSISQDLQEKSLQNKTILPDTLAYGILFYPAEAQNAANLQLLLVETDTGISHRLKFNLSSKNKKL